MIEFKNVNLNFGDIVVFNNFSEQFEPNKINCILGPSGCGKTTLLNILSGTVKENSGEVTKPSRCSYVFQEDLLIPQKTAYKNLEIVLKSVYQNKAELKAVLDKFLKLAGLYDAKDLYPNQMSGGMRQRLSLMRAFAYPSEILLMDEAFKALDTTLKANIIKEFLTLFDQNERTVLFVTHSIDEALLTADHIYVYSNKPMQLLQKFTIDEPRETRKLYSNSLTAVKNEIYKETEKWN
jgi:NitT/TauT family transport system ATP-binding protein